MGFVDANTLMRLRNWPLVSPNEFFFWIPPEAVIKERGWILNSHTSPCWIPVSSFAIRSLNVYLVLGIVWNPRFTINSWNSNVETSKIIFCSSELLPVPVVKFTKNRDRFSRRCPFLVNEISIRLQVQTVLLIRTTNVEETTFSIFKSLEPPKKYWLIKKTVWKIELTFWFPWVFI